MNVVLVHIDKEGNMLPQPKANDKELIKQYTKGKPVKDICSDLGISRTTLFNRLRINGIKVGRFSCRCKLDKTELVKLLKDGMNYGEIGEKLGASRLTVRNACHLYNISKHYCAVSKKSAMTIDIKKARRLYEKEGMSIAAVAKEMGCSATVIYKNLLAAGVPMRSRGCYPRDHKA
jgi:DNA invertase Pin-like site-specific DNA recombinase